MRTIRQRDTGPEIQVRRALHLLGLRYRVNYSPLPNMRSRADIVFTKQRLAIYIDGCFWHGCPIHGTQPKNNATMWQRKLDSNRERDRRYDEILSNSGWRVLRFWSHELPLDVASAIQVEVGARTIEYRRQRVGN